MYSIIDTIFTWLDATPSIVATLGSATIDFKIMGLNTVFEYRVVVEFE